MHGGGTGLRGQTDGSMCCEAGMGGVDEGRVPPSPGRGMWVGGAAKLEQVFAVGGREGDLGGSFRGLTSRYGGRMRCGVICPEMPSPQRTVVLLT